MRATGDRQHPRGHNERPFTIGLPRSPDWCHSAECAATRQQGPRARRARALPRVRVAPTVNTRFPLSFLLVLLVSAAVPAKTADLSATWRTVDLAIDGHDLEWPGGATLLPASPVAIGVANDGEFLYVRLRTSDRGAGLQWLYGGLTVWIDPGGKEKKVFGIRYPVGARLPEPGSRGRSSGRPGEPSSGAERPAPDAGPQARAEGRAQGSLPDPALIVPARVELLGPGKDDARSLVLEHLPPGVAVGIARVENALVYELKVPLGKSAERPYAIGAAPGALIGLGLETGKIERPEAPGRSGGAMGGGRPPGGGGGGGGMGGGMMGRGRGGAGGGGGAGNDLRDTPKPVKVWTRVQLATAPS